MLCKLFDEPIYNLHYGIVVVSKCKTYRNYCFFVDKRMTGIHKIARATLIEYWFASVEMK